jgi:nicotinamide-nucleotide amidase
VTHVELINIGTELLLGATPNTHQSWLGRRLAALGYPVQRQLCVGDDAAAIGQAVRESLGRAGLVIVTGGLGPTADDLTRPVVAELLGCPLREDPLVLEHIEQVFRARGRPMPVGARVQALVPAGATVLPNLHGTAPGLAMSVPGEAFGAPGTRRLVILLPGPPRELHPMFQNEVVPLLLDRLPQAEGFACRTLRSTGLSESVVEERLAEPLAPLVELGLEIGYCARPGEVDVRLLCRGEEASAVVHQAEQLVRARLGKHVFGVDDDQLETVIVRLLTARKQTLALAESCTGGIIAHRLTNVPGASAVFLCGLVTYGYHSKEYFLGVHAETLATHGAVSEQTAREMAEGARQRSGADFALAVTGIAGPSGGSRAKPVGTVYLALATAWDTNVVHRFNPYDRETFKYVTSQQALELLRQALLAG